MRISASTLRGVLVAGLLWHPAGLALAQSEPGDTPAAEAPTSDAPATPAPIQPQAAIAPSIPLLPTERPSYFNTTEIRRDSLTPFSKWTSVLRRHAEEFARLSNPPCLVTKFSACHWQEWLDLIETAKTRPPRERLDMINTYMNRQPYVFDITNWGVEDYWETPGEFFARDGDCEDFAIAKYLSLRRAGFAIDQLRLVILRDMNLRTDHAVLVVMLEGETLVLDNQIPQIVPASTIHHYRPVYSINETNWWLHRPLSALLNTRHFG